MHLRLPDLPRSEEARGAHKHATMDLLRPLGRSRSSLRPTWNASIIFKPHLQKYTSLCTKKSAPQLCSKSLDYNFSC
ncbi:Oidioi.mRNA.OKI2018_I69.XSR.g15333.t1.cds [Oikopleura dioica]|uniref:Oidioi.mRNA.OKI2018_I69.XSR.g15333.t1.cds n=1 Tax=Oikopleura dioica TaxID=34765 RepID=A0ABN7SEE6_OIKDI|nr:Oidioi.mRNA.OKI2018_I69.XSR.g15333.t1.cds [Oikopleura dioica]